jgi:hypothetical protein
MEADFAIFAESDRGLRSVFVSEKGRQLFLLRFGVLIAKFGEGACVGSIE